jgi:hypothetical protein
MVQENLGGSVMNSILKSAFNDEVLKHPNISFPPLVLVQALDRKRDADNLKQIAAGKAPFNEMKDLSGNIINLEEYSNEFNALNPTGSDRRRLIDPKTKQSS